MMEVLNCLAKHWARINTLAQKTCPRRGPWWYLVGALEGHTLCRGTDTIKQLSLFWLPLCSRGKIQNRLHWNWATCFQQHGRGQQWHATQGALSVRCKTKMITVMVIRQACKKDVFPTEGSSENGQNVVFRGKVETEPMRGLFASNNWLAKHEGKVQSWWTYFSIPLKWKIIVFHLGIISKWVHRLWSHCFGGRLHPLLKTLATPPYGNIPPKGAVVTWHGN